LKKIAILDSGIGNIRSVMNIFERQGYIVSALKNSPIEDDFYLVVLPGVGSAGSAAEAIYVKFRTWLLERSATEKKIMGICLGFQLMCEGTEESGGIEGLGLLPGVCKPLERFENTSLRVGWHQVSYSGLLSSHGSDYYYFNHAFGLDNNDTNFNNTDYRIGVVENTIAWVRNQNIIGIQFHPEKSQLAGKHLIYTLAEEK
jgi:imidazole glycerol-phosphate synthase subunit HisH